MGLGLILCRGQTTRNPTPNQILRQHPHTTTMVATTIYIVLRIFPRIPRFWHHLGHNDSKTGDRSVDIVAGTVHSRCNFIEFVREGCFGIDYTSIIIRSSLSSSLSSSRSIALALARPLPLTSFIPFFFILRRMGEKKRA